MPPAAQAGASAGFTHAPVGSDCILIAEETQLELRTHSWQPIATAPEQKDLKVRLEDALGLGG
jgi:hypothetical protein